MVSIELAKPPKPSGITLEEALKGRRSKRAGWRNNVSFDEVSRLLWAAYGHTEGHRHTVPSAGATYPLELFVVAKSVGGIKQGIYRYFPERHALEDVKPGDVSKELGAACEKYSFVKDAPLCIVLAAEFSRTASRFGERAIRYVHMECGSAYQNVSLEAVNLGLGTVVVGAFDDAAVKSVLGTEFEPLAILPVG